MPDFCEVRINGHVFKMRAELGAGQEYVRELAEYVDGVFQDVSRQSRNQASDRIAIMAAIRIADTLFQTRQTPGHVQPPEVRRVAAVEKAIGRLISESDILLDE